ncbi:hypothetical protein [Paenibacillus radicis (ex Xue et al. 2023)]|uniref:Uncharacterized protein n=1 Tax=Paenibacillus radicis (ex Xue et al. 2023) TaxID=2972489 RepID=A0ABT1YNW3_9BACL|nr:hypothetical protein [Paenibacillus radicis (ex Xue et al. 2023)]MCR8634868.1 hypothetical protein [Paenibacillus radicis (ex Xue et al. 2023)]
MTTKDDYEEIKVINYDLAPELIKEAIQNVALPMVKQFDLNLELNPKEKLVVDTNFKIIDKIVVALDDPKLSFDQKNNCLNILMISTK